MYIPVGGPSRAERLKKRRSRKKFARLAKVSFTLMAALLLTLLLPANLPIDKSFTSSIFTVSGNQQPPPPPPRVEYSVVYISGAVNTPGVVKVPAGTTVGDVISLAGGPAADADLARTDITQPAKDEMHIIVNKKAGAPAKK